MKKTTFLLVFILAHTALSGMLIYAVWYVFEVRYGSNTALSVFDNVIRVAANLMLSPVLFVATLMPGVERLPRLLVVPSVIVNSALWALVVWRLIPKRWKALNNRFQPTSALKRSVGPQVKKMRMKQIIKKTPVVGPVAHRIYRMWINSLKPFEGSENYWKGRYEAGGNSGDGSYNHLAEFKAEVLNAWVSENKITSVIEFGCGDGNQLGLAQYPKYIGFDVSPEALSMCSERFSNDETKAFKLMGAYGGETAELTLSLDVIYHLVEDSIFVKYMDRLFDSSERFVVIYSSDTDDNPENTAVHVRHRHFSKWITDNKRKWKLIKHIPNKYPFNGDTQSGSLADFFIYSGRSDT